MREGRRWEELSDFGSKKVEVQERLTNSYMVKTQPR